METAHVSHLLCVKPLLLLLLLLCFVRLAVVFQQALGLQFVAVQGRRGRGAQRMPH
jgi:hypothetical protein